MLCLACSTDDGRQLADPDPDLTRVTTTAPTATGEAARGGAASALAVPVSSAGPDGLEVASPDFAAGAALPLETTCDGADRAPTITWAGSGDEPLALVVRDADGGGSVHWLVTDLVGPTGTVGRDGAPGSVRANSSGVEGWTGPCPDDDLEHRYVFTLYSLPEAFELPPSGDAPADVAAIEEAHLGAATLLGVYARP
jgi:phosphatidylethanolamine-binding protein (PEBP) family uncharacterized protein